jgi:hypothetical protein
MRQLSRDHARQCEDDLERLHGKLGEVENAPAAIKPRGASLLADEARSLEEQCRLAHEVEGVTDHLLRHGPNELAAYQFLKDRVRDFLRLLH